jgi:hypothetical protein
MAGEGKYDTRRRSQVVKAAVCKTAITSSILVVASSDFELEMGRVEHIDSAHLLRFDVHSRR